MKELAERCGVTTRTVSAWESGGCPPRVAMHRQIAAALEYPLGFFERDSPDSFAVEDVTFRALSAMTARERDQALAAGALGAEIGAWLQARFSLPQPDLPDLAHLAPEAAASSVRDAWQLGDRPIGTVLHLLESKGALVFSLAEGLRQLDAFATWRGDTPYVFLSTTKSAARQRFDLAHELGHLLRHRQAVTVRGRTFEQEADRFGSAFLLPASGIYGRAQRRITLEDVLREKRYWGVSAMAYVFRLHQLQLLSDWHYRSFCIELAKMGYRRSEPADEQAERSLLLRKVSSAMADSHLTAEQIVIHLQVPLDELTALTFGELSTKPVGAISRHLRLVG